MRLKLFHEQIILQPNRIKRFAIERNLYLTLVDPVGDAHRDLAGRLVLQSDLATVRQRTGDIDPRRATVQQQVDIHSAIQMPQHSVPHIVESLGTVRRATIHNPRDIQLFRRSPAGKRAHQTIERGYFFL